MPSRRLCPGCQRRRWIPLATGPYCTESCQRAAIRREADMIPPPAPKYGGPVPGPFVHCCICGATWPAHSPGVEYRSLDHQWWCADETDCTNRAARVKAQMLAALDAAWDQLERDGWRI